MPMLTPLFGFLFATPLAAALTAFGAVALPVVIHLLNRRRFKVVEWAAMRFLVTAQKKNNRKIRIEHWLLLLVRMLLVALLALAMAAVAGWLEPLWRTIIPEAVTQNTFQGRTHRIIVLDASMSMQTVQGDSTRAARAIAQANKVLDKGNPGDGYSLVVMGYPAQTVIAGLVDDKDKVRKELDRMVFPQGSADLTGGLKAVADMVARPVGKYAAREVWIVTDLKRTAWNQLTQTAPTAPRDGASAPASDGLAGPGIRESWELLTRNAKTAVIDVAGADEDNLSVIGVQLNDPLPLVGMDVSLSANIQNNSRIDRRGVKAELLVGRMEGDKFRWRSVEQKPIDLRAGETVTATFALQDRNRFREAGDYILEVRLESDKLAIDDSRRIAVAVRDTIPVLVVNGKEASDWRDRPGEILSVALNPFPPDRPLAGYPARPRLITPVEFDDAALGDLSEFDVVFLCDLPSMSNSRNARLENYVRRGGTVFFSFGSNSAAAIPELNRVLWNEGKGLLPGKLIDVRKGDDRLWFTLSGDEDSYRLPPLAGLQSDDLRAGLSLAWFAQYVRLEPPAGKAARKILSFAPTGPDGKRLTPDVIGKDKPRPVLDPALIEWTRGRGRVIAYTSTLEPSWNFWAKGPTFALFMQELLRHAVAGGSRRNLAIGEPVEEFFPSSMLGLSATVARYEGETEVASETVGIVGEDDFAVVRTPAREQSGVVRVGAAGAKSRLFAVNSPVNTPAGGPEGDLRRTPPEELRTVSTEEIDIVADVGDASTRIGVAKPIDGETPMLSPRGPIAARTILLILGGLVLLELWLGWRLGSARAGTSATDAPAAGGLTTTIAIASRILIAVALVLVLVVLHGMATGEFLGFLPDSMRQPIEEWAGVPKAAPGEGTRWRLERAAWITGDPRADRWLIPLTVVVALLVVRVIYRRERLTGQRAIDRPARRRMIGLRVGFVLLLAGVLLPQLRLSFEREGWPEVVILIDDSRSMSDDRFTDPALAERIEELKTAWKRIRQPLMSELEGSSNALKVRLATKPGSDNLKAELARQTALLDDLGRFHRLNLIKAIVCDTDRDFLGDIVNNRKMKIHLWRVSDRAVSIGEAETDDGLAAMRREVMLLMPVGEASSLGGGIASVLRSFRGSSLSAVVMFTDGVTTKGEDIPAMARLAASAGVPLTFAGVGDNTDPLDIALSDLQSEEVINTGDRLVMEFRLKGQGPGLPATVPVTLSRLDKDGKPVTIATQDVAIDTGARPTKVRFIHAPTEAGEHTFVIDTPVLKDEVEKANNRLEKTVYVAEFRRIKVLMVDATPRYDFRFIKTLFERETDAVRGNKSIELSTFLVSSNPDAARQDKSALTAFPSSTELDEYDVLILGDVEPKQFPRPEVAVQSVCDFVRKRGGGLILLSGEQAMPHAWRETALADIAPIQWEGAGALPAPPSAENPAIAQSYTPRLSPAGLNHPLFRFAADEAKNAEIWSNLAPLFWYQTGYRRKLTAEVLAVHPDRPAEGLANENHPLVLQQFVGAGRVLFMGFDDTWRWRLRQDETRFNQFWIQAIRSLSRSRIGRPEVRLDKQTAYRRNEPIRVTVRFPDNQPAPEGEIRVDVERTPLGGGETELRSLTLAPREGLRATWETILTRTPEGSYRFSLTQPLVVGAKPKAEGRVLPPPGELDRLQLNEADMQKAARETTGRYYALDRADDIPKELPETQRVALDQPRPPILLWNHPLLFALMLAMLTTEWLARKRSRLL